MRLFFSAFIALNLFSEDCLAQFQLRGTVYDNTGVYPLGYVSIITTSGTGTLTDSNGRFSLFVNRTDSVWFSYLEKPTKKFPVNEIINPADFNISLKTSMTILKEVKVSVKNYRLDSIQNRIEYAKVFNYEKPSLKTIITSIGITGFTIDIDELIRAFQYRKKRNMLNFQKRLLEQEKEKFINHRFNKALVRRLTGLDSCHLDTFMVKYRPTYELTLRSSDYEFQEFIFSSLRQFKKE